jgi:hypothetical protein
MRSPGQNEAAMEFLILGIIAIPCLLLFLFILALATGVIHEGHDPQGAARGLRDSWDTLAHRH